MRRSVGTRPKVKKAEQEKCDSRRFAIIRGGLSLVSTPNLTHPEREPIHPEKRGTYNMPQKWRDYFSRGDLLDTEIQEGASQVYGTSVSCRICLGTMSLNPPIRGFIFLRFPEPINPFLE